MISVPLREAVILYNPLHAGQPPVLVKHIREHHHMRQEGYYSSTGAVNIVYAGEALGIALIRLHSTFNALVVRERLDPQEVHRAFLAIPEYRYTIPEDTEGAEDAPMSFQEQLRGC